MGVHLAVTSEVSPYASDICTMEISTLDMQTQEPLSTLFGMNIRNSQI